MLGAEVQQRKFRDEKGQSRQRNFLQVLKLKLCSKLFFYVKEKGIRFLSIEYLIKVGM